MSRVTGSLLGGSFEDQLILCALISFLFQYSFTFGSLCCCVGFSPVVAGGGGNSLTVVGAQASHSSFSCCGAWA